MSRPIPPDSLGHDRKSYPNYSPDASELEVLSAYLDNALPEAERTAVEQRLNTDPALRTMLESLRGTVLVLKSAPVLAPPRDFRLDPATLRRSVPHPRRRVWVALGTLSAAAAVLLVALIAAGGLTNSAISAPRPVALVATRPPNALALSTNVPTAKAAISESGNATGPTIQLPATAAATESAPAADQAVRSSLAPTSVPATPSPAPSITLAAKVTQAAALAATSNAPVVSGASGGVSPQYGASNNAVIAPSPGSTQPAATSVPAAGAQVTMLALQPTTSAAIPSATNKVLTLWDFIRWLFALFGLKGLP